MSEDTTTNTPITVTDDALYQRGSELFIAVSDSHLERFTNPDGLQIPATRDFLLYASPGTPTWHTQMVTLRVTLENALQKIRHENEGIRTELRLQRNRYEGLGQALLEQAVDKDWCDEYDEFAEEWDLPKRTREYTVTIEIPVMASSEEEAQELVDGFVSISPYETWFIDYPTASVSER